IKPDSGAAVSAKLLPNTIAQKVAPGERDLKNAQSIQVTDLALGDRVLVTLQPGTSNARRIIVMGANDIARRNAADRADWNHRGVAGIVSARNGNDVTVKMRGSTGDI